MVKVKTLVLDNGVQLNVGRLTNSTVAEIVKDLEDNTAENIKVKYRKAGVEL